MKINDRISKSKWTVLTAAPSVRWGDGKSVRTAWYCRCICGTESIVTNYALVSGRSKQCRKCSTKLAAKAASRVLFKHGYAASARNKYKAKPTYNSWYAMIQRCTNPKNKRWNKYGGRGITVCSRWKTSFINFLKDMGERPDGRTLDRVNVNGNYKPSNCRWATLLEQRHNRTDS